MACGKSTIGGNQKSPPNQFKIEAVESQQLEETRKSSEPVQDRSCAKSTIGGNQKILRTSSRSMLWKVNKRNKIRADSPTTKPKDHLPHEAPGGPISTFKIKPQRPLKKFQMKVQEQASTALEEISSPIQDQASNGPWINIYNKGLQNASSTRDKHMYTTRLEVGAFVDIEISVK
ncbi:hypothetical protein ACFX15_042881 [Malus domestica]